MTTVLLVTALAPVLGLIIYDWYTSDNIANHEEDKEVVNREEKEEIVSQLIDDCSNPATDYLYDLGVKYVYPYVSHLIPSQEITQEIIKYGLFFGTIVLWQLFTDPRYDFFMQPIKQWLFKTLFSSLGGNNNEEEADSFLNPTRNPISEEEKEMLLCIKEGYLNEASLRQDLEFFKEFKNHQEKIDRLKKLLENSSDPALQKEYKGLTALVNYRMKRIAIEVKNTSDFLHQQVQECHKIAKNAADLSNWGVGSKCYKNIYQEKFYRHVDSRDCIKGLSQWYYFCNTGHKMVTGNYVDIPTEHQESLRRLHLDVSGKRIAESDR